MPIVRLTNGSTFDAAAGTTLLDAARGAGLVLPHSCRTGRCGTCKVRLSSGLATPAGADLCLTAEERSSGWVLTCVSQAETELSLETEAVEMPSGYDLKTLPCRIQSLDRMAPDVLRVKLRLPPRHGLRYLAGQYIDLIAPDGSRRSYSIANAPAGLDQIELHVRQVPGGLMSSYWFDRAKPEDLLRFEGPRGTFFLRDIAGRELVFLATGTGLAPVKAMLESLAAVPRAARPCSIALFWGGRRPEDLYCEPAPEGLDVDYVPVLSRAGPDWAGARGHVQDRLLDRRPDWHRISVYACGSEAMIEDARRALLAAGLAARRFQSDAFVSSS